MESLKTFCKKEKTFFLKKNLKKNEDSMSINLVKMFRKPNIGHLQGINQKKFVWVVRNKLGCCKVDKFEQKVFFSDRVKIRNSNAHIRLSVNNFPFSKQKILQRRDFTKISIPIDNLCFGKPSSFCHQAVYLW